MKFKDGDPRLRMLIAYLDNLRRWGKADTPSPDFDRALTAALTEIDLPFRRTVSIRGYTIRLKEDEHAF